MHVALTSNPTSIWTVFSTPCVIFVAQIVSYSMANLNHENDYLFNYALVYWMGYWPITCKPYCTFMQIWLEFQLWMNVGLWLNFDWQMLLFEWCGAFVTYPMHNLACFVVFAFVCFLLGNFVHYITATK